MSESRAVSSWPRLLLPAAVAVNLVALFSPGSGGPTFFPGSDKVAHALLFALVAWPAVRVGLRWPWVAGVLLVHAVVSEVVQQQFVRGRAGDPWDAAADLVGVTLGVLLALRGRAVRLRAAVSRSDGSRSGR